MNEQHVTFGARVPATTYERLTFIAARIGDGSDISAAVQYAAAAAVKALDESDRTAAHLAELLDRPFEEIRDAIREQHGVLDPRPLPRCTVQIGRSGQCERWAGHAGQHGKLQP